MNLQERMKNNRNSNFLDKYIKNLKIVNGVNN